MLAKQAPMAEAGKGVRGWCQSVQEAGGLEAIGALQKDVNLLIIHVDAAIVLDKEHDAAHPCPPPESNLLAAEEIAKIGRAHV